MWEGQLLHSSLHGSKNVYNYGILCMRMGGKIQGPNYIVCIVTCVCGRDDARH